MPISSRDTFCVETVYERTALTADLSLLYKALQTNRREFGISKKVEVINYASES